MTKQGKKDNSRIYLLAGALTALACVVLAAGVWTAFNYPLIVSAMGLGPAAQSQPEIQWAQVDVVKPAATAVDMNVLAAQATSTPLPPPEPSPLPSATASPFPTDIPTETPTATPEPTETPAQLAMEVLLDTPTPEYVPPTAGPKPVYASSGNGARWIDVDLTNQMVYAYEGDVIVNSFVVSTGTWQTPTVTGKYKIYVKIRSGNMHGPGYFLPDVPYIMYFHKGYGLHGTYWHNNFGTPMSHGCVNLRTDEAGWLFNWASVGTVVNVHY